MLLAQVPSFSKICSENPNCAETLKYFLSSLTPTYDPAMLLLNDYSKKILAHIRKGTCMRIVIAGMVRVSAKVEVPLASITRGTVR